MGKLAKRISVGALLLVFMLATTAFGQTEILVNGDFESWDDLNTPTGWTKVENIDKDSTGVHGGTYAAKHTGGTKDLGQYVTVTPGYSYTITLWCKVESGDNSDARLWAYWRGAGANVGAAIESPYFGATDHSDWATWTTTLEAPEGTDTLYFEVRTYSGAVAYWDDLSVIETPPPPEDPYDYFIPKGSHEKGWATLKEAVDSINANGVVGEINLILDADTLREESFTFTADLDAENNVTVKPAEGRDVVLIVTPGESQGNGIQMIGFDKAYVTFDGSNDGTNSRNLLVTTETTDTRVVFGLNTADADNIVIKNLVIKNLDNVDIDIKIAVCVNDIGGNSFVVDNCQIGSVEHPIWRDGIAFWGDWTNGMVTAVVTNSEIHAGVKCIDASLGGECTFNNNSFYLHPGANLSSSSYAYARAIDLSWVGSTEVKNNVFYAVEKSTSTIPVVALSTASHPAGAVIDVENNMIVVGAADETNPVYGLGMRSSNNMRTFNLSHNTIIVNDNTGTSVAHAIGQFSGDGTIDVNLKNNIIINNHTGNTASSAITMSGANHTLTSNNNVLVSDQNFVNYHGTDYADLAAWQAAGQDANSVSKAVTFASATDLHLATPSDTDLDLLMPAIGVAEDIDGDARGTFYAYAGADEGTAYPESNDLYIGFKDDTDLANWTRAATWIGFAHDSSLSALVASDAGWSMSLNRPVNATPGSVYRLVMRMKTGAWEGGTLNVAVEGLGNDLVSKSIVSDTAWAEYTIIGIADAESGTIHISGSYPATHDDTLWVDSLAWDDQYKDIIPSDDIASVKADYAFPDYVACSGVVTAVTIGAPIFMQDATAGVALYDWDFINDGIVEEGDEILVVGQRTAYKGLEQIQNTNDNYVVLSKGNLVEPTIITVPDLESRDYQGMLVMIEDVDTVDGFNWPNEGQYMNIDLTDESGNEFIMFIDNDSEIDGATPPESWPLDLIGIVQEYNVPEISPRYMEDFITNQAPQAFTILNPANDVVFTSFGDTGIVDLEMDGDTVKAMFVNWTDANDPEGDSLVYEMHFIGDGPDEAMTTADTFMYIPLDEEEPYSMNGTYTYYFTATDPMGEVSNSDTHTVSFDFPAPPQVVASDIVLVEGVPTYYIQYDMPVAPLLANYKVIDHSNSGAVIDPTAINGMMNYVMVSAPMVEDAWYSLVSLNVESAADSNAAEPITRVDTTRGLKVYIPFSENHPEDVTTIETFEAGTGTFWAPTGSGSTSGLLTTSTLTSSADEAYRGEKSGKLVLLDDPAKTGGWMVRLYHGKVRDVSTTSTIMYMVKGSSDAIVEMNICIADPSYELGPWKTVSLSEDDWQVVTFDLANDEAEGWYNGDGVVDGSTVKIDDIRIRCSEDVDVTLYVDEFTERKIINPVDITLNVMMDEWLRLGQFNLAMDYVDVSGSFNDWPSSGVSPSMLSDFDGDTTYSITIPMMPYSTQYFKFRINGSWDDGKHEFDHNGAARELLVPTSAHSYTYWFNDDTLQVAVDGIPAEFALHQNYPNPFNPTTTINFDLPEAADVKLVIYDITGRKVRTLVNETSAAAGYKMIIWNGRDDFGNGVATGMYIYRLVAGDFVDVKKMTFLK